MNRKYRKTVIAGNWKMNKTPSETKEFMQNLKAIMPKGRWCDVALCVPAICIPAAVRAMRETRVGIGAENCNANPSGAYTGEISTGKFGYKNEKMKNFSLSVNYDFKSQFNTGYDYLTPSVPSDKYQDADGNVPGLNDLPHKDQISLWKDARKIKSGFLAPAYTNLAVGIDVKPFKWLSLNIAPLTGGVVIVRDELLRKNYGMQLKDQYLNTDPSELNGACYKPARFEFGAQVKADIAVKVNDNFAYTSQLVLFSNYLDHPENIRVNWDNRFDWKLAKYFSFTLTTNMIYDDKVMIFSEKDGLTKQRVQFKQSMLFGFTYTIASKK